MTKKATKKATKKTTRRVVKGPKVPMDVPEVIASLEPEKSEYYKGLQRGLVRVDPDLAMKILELNTNNRNLSQSAVNRYAADMEAGEWAYDTTAIVISSDMVLLDGQTRLWAVVQSDTMQEFTFLYGPPAALQMKIDIGRSRSFGDALKLSGRVGARSRWVSSISNRVFLGTAHTGRLASRAMQLKFFDKHRERIVWAAEKFIDGGYKREICRAPVVAAVVRASYYVDDLEMLERFITILRDGLATAEERSAIVLRDWLHRPVYRGGESQGVEAFLRVSGTIRAFIHGNNLTRLSIPHGDLFPLPEIDPATGIKNGLTRHRVSWYRKHFGEEREE